MLKIQVVLLVMLVVIHMRVLSLLGILLLRKILWMVVVHRMGLNVLAEWLVLRDILEQQAEEDDSDRVQLLTMHASKGLEFPHVFIMGLEEEILPHRSSIEEGNIEEERRLMYVGITRARESLAITQALTRKQYGEKVDTLASRFLEELPLDDLQYIGEGFKKDEEQEDQVAQASIANLKALLD